MEVLSMQTTITENTIRHGDNLYITHKYISDKSIDLIYRSRFKFVVLSLYLQVLAFRL